MASIGRSKVKVGMGLVAVLGLLVGVIDATVAAAAGGGKNGGISCRRNCPDTVAPTIVIGTPATDTVVSGSVVVQGTASDNIAVTSVQVAVGTGPWATASGTASWSAAIDSATQNDGESAISVRALDAAGNIATSYRPVEIDNGQDGVAPTVSITAPGSGTIVAGTLAVSGSANDDVGVAAVTVSIDGGAAITATGTTAWTVGLDTSTWSAGPHTLTARSTDAAGNTGVAAVTVSAAPTPPPGEGNDVVISDPMATGTLSSLLRTRLIQHGDLTGVLYLDQAAYRPAVYFRDIVTRQASLVDLPADSNQGWVYAAAVMSSPSELWVVGGSTTLTLRQYQLSGSPLPTTASLLATRTFGNGDSRPGDMILLASGGLVLAWHQQGVTGPQGQHVAYRSPEGNWTQLPPLTFMPTASSDQVLGQHPADGSVWLFANPDMWSAVGVAHLSERNGTLAPDWTQGSFISGQEHGLYGPDPEDPDLAVAADFATNTLALAYQSADRRWYYQGGLPKVIGSRVAIARIPAAGAASFVMSPAFAERVSDVGLVISGPDTVVTYHPIDEATLGFDAIHAGQYRDGAWQTPVVLGEGGRVSYGAGRVELAVRLTDSELHLFTSPAG